MQIAPPQVTSLPLAGAHYIGFWARLFASVVDTVLLLIVVGPLTALVFGVSEADADALMGDPAHFLLQTVLPAMVVLLFWARVQATPGKMLLKARIVDAETGGMPRVSQLLVRYVGYFVSTIVFGLGFLWIAFDTRKQGWHDKMAGTVVVRDSAKRPADSA